MRGPRAPARGALFRTPRPPSARGGVAFCSVFAYARRSGRMPGRGVRALVDPQRRTGRFYTEANPFRHPAFRRWARSAGLPGGTVLEPFAGANRLMEHLRGLGLCGDFRAYDLRPAARGVRRRDTLASFPKGFDICVTNPPWLARNVATRLGMDFPDCGHRDVYGHALERCLSNCGWVAALVPESFLRTGLFRGRLRDFVSLTRPLFRDTAHPVGLAMFGPEDVADTRVWSGGDPVGALSELEAMRPAARRDGPDVRFNDPRGNVGLIALDNTLEASIRFCRPEDLGDYRIDGTRRSITRIRVGCRVRLGAWNRALGEFREATRDVLMTPFRGLRRDGRYRRRCDWALARGIIHRAA